MLSYSKYPFLRFLVALMAGIVLFEFVEVSCTWVLYAIVGGLLLLFILFTPGKIAHDYKKNVYLGFVLQVLFFVLGYGNAQWAHRSSPALYLEDADAVICRITQTPVKKTRSFKSEAWIEKAFIHNSWVDINKKMIIYCPLDTAPPFKYDQVVCMRSTVKTPSSPANPYQFNYKKYLQKKGVYYQTYCKPGEVVVLGEDHTYTIDDFAEHSVQYTRQVFYSLIPDSNLAAIATALLVGFQEELDPETKTSFSRVGAMHILAVSGLHVGIIFILLSKILFLLDRNTYTKILKTILLILFLWGYAIIAGFSPSIVRAALMFTLLIPSISFKVSGNAYNNIASSAFLLLLWNSNYLFDVGFQLSYVAVFGIIYLYPFLKNWVSSKYWIVDQLWQLTAVSIAATIFTCPIVLYNFGQFPLSFLLSNLIAVPISTFIIYVGLGAVVFYKIGWVAAVLGKLLYALLWILNESIAWIESLPYAYLDHLLINRWQVVILYGLIISIIWYFQYRKIHYLKTTLVLVAVFLTTLIYRRYEVLQHQELYMYNLNKTSYIEFIDGHQAVNVLEQPLSDLDYGLFIRTNHQHTGVFTQTTSNRFVQVFSPGFQVRDTRFFMIENRIPASNKVLETDYLILSKINYLDTALLKNQFRCRQIILLNNHTFKKQKKLEELLVLTGLPFYSLASQGCFRLKY
jgi:competence protein ComEC